MTRGAAGSRRTAVASSAPGRRFILLHVYVLQALEAGRQEHVRVAGKPVGVTCPPPCRFRTTPPGHARRARPNLGSLPSYSTVVQLWRCMAAVAS